MDPLRQLTIQGFRSIKDLTDFELKPGLNVFIGANGAGKSNLISFFRLLHAFMDGNLGEFTINHGGVSSFLYEGRKTTESIFFKTEFGERGHKFNLAAGASEEPISTKEARYYEFATTGWWEMADSYDGKSSIAKHAESNASDAKFSQPIVDAVKSWQIYHFHDTSRTAAMKHYEIVQDDKELRSDAGNIAPYLRRLQTFHHKEYKSIVNAVNLVTPFFEDFNLEPRMMGEAEKVNLSWKQKGSDYPFQPYHLSDGTIRFIALATALLQPNPPSAIIIDEPELGLHPHALAILAELIQDAGTRTQLIIATQSETLLNHFAIEDIVVVNREQGASTFKRLKEEDYKHWLESYSVGQLWSKNVITGGPSYE